MDLTGTGIPSEIRGYYDSLGGREYFGDQVATAQVITQNGGGIVREFEKGWITYSYASKRVGALMRGAFLDAYRLQGGASSNWGFIYDRAICYLREAGCRLNTQYGVLAYTAGSGVIFVGGPIASKWSQQGHETGSLGYPTANAKAWTDEQWPNDVRSQTFQHGAVVEMGDRVSTLSLEEFQAVLENGGPQALADPGVVRSIANGDALPVSRMYFTAFK